VATDRATKQMAGRGAGEAGKEDARSACSEQGNVQLDRDAAVREWMGRKAEHAESPLARLSRGEALVQQRCPGKRAEARVNGAVLVRTERAQVVNQRIYFPIEDFVAAMLRDSPKRWR